MLKKTFGLALALILAMSVTAAFPAEAAAVAVVNYGMEGGNIYFDTVTGTVTGCDTTVTRAAIPEEIRGFAVKAIGEDAFKECGKLQSVSIK